MDSKAAKAAAGAAPVAGTPASSSAAGPSANADAADAAANAASEPVDPLPHCGSFDEMTRESGRIFPRGEFFDGARFEQRKPVFSEQLIVSHFLAMGQTYGAGFEDGQPDQYQYGATYVSKDQRTALIGKFGSDSVLRAHVIQSWTESLVSKIQARVSPLPGDTVFNGEVDYKGKNFGAAARFINRDAFFLSYMQKIFKPELALGTELMYIRPQMRSVSTVGLRYATMDFVATLRGSTERAFSASYMRKVTDQIFMATEIDYNARSRESSMKVAYEYIGRTARVRGEVSSTGTVGVLLEKMVMMGLNVQLCGSLDHKKQTYKFGIGATLG